MASSTVDHIDSGSSPNRPEMMDHVTSAEMVTANSNVEAVQNEKHARRWLPGHDLPFRPDARIEPRPYVHKYVFRRPRLRQYFQNGELVNAQGQRIGPRRMEDLTRSHSSRGEGDRDTADTSNSGPQMTGESGEDVVKAQKEWLDLFIDLLWTGIISNVADSFVANAFQPGNDWGLPFLQFTVLFVTSFRLWNGLRKLLIGYFTKDFLQSLFLVWIVILAMFFGNQAPYFLDKTGGEIVIVTYLTARGSFLLMEAFYCIFIPETRREFLISMIVTPPVIGLWTGSLWLSWPTRAALMLPALSLEILIPTIMALPLGDWLLHGAPKKALDPNNLVDRLQGFFIIVLGEGVYGLVTGNNWGVGFTPRVACAIDALIIYYILFWLFFTGDQTKTYIQAVFRNHYTAIGFQTCHNVLFSSVLILDASISWLIDHGFDDTDDSPIPLDSLSAARWTISGALTTAILSMTIKVLLNRSLDQPGTLVVNNRYIRMAPRLMVCVVILCLPVVNPLSTSTFMNVLFSIMTPLVAWEYFAGLERPWGWIEPKHE